MGHIRTVFRFAGQRCGVTPGRFVGGTGRTGQRACADGQDEGEGPRGPPARPWTCDHGRLSRIWNAFGFRNRRSRRRSGPQFRRDGHRSSPTNAKDDRNLRR
ncbi:hypothetical protein SL003B_4289 [Polymorphum gilvum SL003B-26A1]|uniref:Uncharacterized protein n=1 Tax=Polymorphum gilvum (strain LMG 25793 / CGMCC 1.9160 / SL003B-26A1) TaxID=991905 RepID=F2IVI9_POLGS|nr:hypothetical protein SL003B_4289 [Polymorphum gilvum SL003B-26A1]